VAEGGPLLVLIALAFRCFRLASPAIALVTAGIMLALMAAEFPLAALAHQNLDAGGKLQVLSHPTGSAARWGVEPAHVWVWTGHPG